MAEATRDVAGVTAPTWTSPPLAVFEAMAATIDARFGPAHIAFHLELPVERMSLWTDREGVPLVKAPPCVAIVMRTDDNGNEVEVRRVTSRCEAAALVREYEQRGHKQTYWIAETQRD